MKRTGDYIQTLAEWAIGLALAVMCILVFGNAAGRYLLNAGLASSDEIARLAFVWLVFIGAVIGVRERAHIGMDLLVQSLPKSGQRLCLVVCNLLILYALWLFIEGSWKQTIIGLGSRAPVTGVPLAAFAAAGLVAGIAMAILFAFDLLKALTGRLKESDLVQVRESADEPQHEADVTEGARKP